MSARPAPAAAAPSSGPSGVIAGPSPRGGDEAAELLKGLGDQLGVEQVVGAATALKERNPLGFFQAFSQPFELLTDKFVDKHLGWDSEAAFLFTNAAFVENHLAQLFATFEGAPCSFDKADWAMRSLARHLLEGEPVVANFSDEYTSHLPTKVLNTQAELVDMYVALRMLHAGRSERYLAQLAAATQKCAALASPPPA